jgi:hypothetical protein
MSHTIDYSDHYAHADPNITSYNYLRFDDLKWKIFNPSIHYQNRLRTPDYRHIFENNGFRIAEIETWKGSKSELDSSRISATFKTTDRQTLLELGCHILLQPISDKPSVEC